jgi:hypothetical protein
MDNMRKLSDSRYSIRYSESFKNEVCLEFMTGRYTKHELQAKYGIKGKTRLLVWLRKSGYIGASNLTIMPRKKPKLISKKSNLSREEIKTLEDAQLKAELYARMIELAEKQYNIKIRKNYDTK